MFHVPKQSASGRDNRFPSGSFMSRIVHHDLIHQQGMQELQKKNRDKMIRAREIRIGNTKVIGARPVKNRLGFSGPGGVVLNNFETVQHYVNAIEPQQVATAAHLRIGSAQSRGGAGPLQSRVSRGGAGLLQSRGGGIGIQPLGGVGVGRGQGNNGFNFNRNRVQKTTGSIYRNKSVVLRGSGSKSMDTSTSSTSGMEEEDEEESIGAGISNCMIQNDVSKRAARFDRFNERVCANKTDLDEEMEEYMGNGGGTDLDKELEEYMAETAKIAKMKKESESKTKDGSIADDEDELFNIAIENTLSEDIVFNVDELNGENAANDAEED